jgi:hypothetical protein
MLFGGNIIGNLIFILPLVVNRFVFTNMKEIGRFLWRKNWMFIHNLDEKSIGSQLLTAMARVRSQPVQLQLDTVALGHIIPQYFGFPLGSILPPLLHPHHVQTALIRRTSGRRLETFKQSNVLRNTGAQWTACHFTLLCINTTARDLRFFLGSWFLASHYNICK